MPLHKQNSENQEYLSNNKYFDILPRAPEFFFRLGRTSSLGACLWDFLNEIGVPDSRIFGFGRHRIPRLLDNKLYLTILYALFILLGALLLKIKLLIY